VTHDATPVRPVRREIRLTPAGYGLAALTLLLTIAAWSVGGASVPAAALALALIGLAPLTAWLQTRGLHVLPPPPVTTFAGERFPLDVPVVNGSRRFAARDVVISHGATGRRGWRAGAYVGSIAPLTVATVASSHAPLPRGRVRLHRLELASSFPFGLARCRLEFEVPVAILALPRLGALRRVDQLTSRLRGLPVHGRADRGDEEEFYGLRNWREGESQRRVHWKLSARRGRLLVREFRGEARPPVHVVLSTGVRGLRGRTGRFRSFDTAVSVAATLVEHFLRRRHPVRLTLLGARARGVGCARGRGGLFPPLAALADVTSEPRAEVLAVREHAERTTRRGEIAMVVVAGGLGNASAVSYAGRSAVVIDVDGSGLGDVYSRARPLGHRALLGIAR
jgi:uncharacterized protein (DUF58 family)